MREHHLAVRRTARYYTLGPDTDDGRPAEVWMACHGYAQLARYFLRSFAPIDDGTRLIAAPEALNRYYFETAPGVHGRDARVAATWMTREDRDHEVADYVGYLDALAGRLLGGSGRGEAGAAAGGAAIPRLVAFGFSQGAATVSRWAARGAARIDDVVLWGSGVAHDLDLRPGLFGGARLTIAIGDADPYISDETVDREDRRLRDAGIEYRLLRYAGGHRVEPEALASLAAALQSGSGPF